MDHRLLKCLVYMPLILAAGCIDDPPPVRFDVRTLAGVYKVKEIYSTDTSGNVGTIPLVLQPCQTNTRISLDADSTYHVLTDDSCERIIPFSSAGRWSAGEVSLIRIDSLLYTVGYYDQKEIQFFSDTVYMGRHFKISETLTRQ